MKETDAFQPDLAQVLAISGDSSAPGYLFVLTAVFPLGIALAAIEMQQSALTRSVPIAAVVVVLIAGALQFTALKARHLNCREAPGCGRTPTRRGDTACAASSTEDAAMPV